MRPQRAGDLKLTQRTCECEKNSIQHSPVGRAGASDTLLHSFDDDDNDVWARRCRHLGGTSRKDVVNGSLESREAKDNHGKSGKRERRKTSELAG